MRDVTWLLLLLGAVLLGWVIGGEVGAPEAWWLLVGAVLAGLIGVKFNRWHSTTETGHHLRRWVCARVGHEPLADERGRPVTAFYVCIRCGKIGGRIE